MEVSIYVELTQNTVPMFVVKKEPNATVWLIDVFLIAFGKQWGSMEQRKLYLFIVRKI